MKLVGDIVLRVISLALPIAQVQRLLAHGLTLGEQDLTPAGTHPVVLFFQDMLDVHLTVPTLLPLMSYHELVVGVPFAYETGACRRGPALYMSLLLLNDYLPVLGGVLFWGFLKRPAPITISENRFSIQALGGGPLVSLAFEPEGGPLHPGQLPHFAPLRRIMDQPLVSQVPFGIGPWFVYSDFDKKWEDAKVRPLATVLTIDRLLVPGLPCGRFPASGRGLGIDQSPLGGFEMKTRFRQSLVYS